MNASARLGVDETCMLKVGKELRRDHALESKYEAQLCPMYGHGGVLAVPGDAIR
jgi:hypothetical protein